MVRNPPVRCGLAVSSIDNNEMQLCEQLSCGLQILRKPDGTSRGFGFVTYRDESMVEKCLVVPHTITGKTVRGPADTAASV